MTLAVVNQAEKKIKALGLLGINTIYGSSKVTKQVKANHIESGIYLNGYEIHIGISFKTDESVSPIFKARRLKENNEIVEGSKSRDGLVWGTYLHGIFDNKEFCRYLISQWRRKKGILSENNDLENFSKDKEYDKLAEIVRNNINKEALYAMVG
ncbi:MAG: hypothetical protein ABIH08_07575 [Candidatus Omnitrophota bacterium]